MQLLVDSGVMDNLTLLALIQALRLPVIPVKSQEITLPNGTKLIYSNKNKVLVYLGLGAVCKIPFTIVKMPLSLFLVYYFLNKSMH